MGITVRTTPKSRVSINSGGTKKLIVNTGAAGPASATNIDNLVELADVDASDVDNNETLVYDDTSGKFVVKELPRLDGGTF